MKLLATADLHLGKQSSSLPKDFSAASTTTTWKRMVSYAIDEQIDAFLIAGDLVDRDNRFFEAIGPVQEGFEKLGKAGIPVVMVSGNHDFDVLPDIIKNKQYKHVFLIGEGGEWEAQSIDTQSGPLQVVGWSFPERYVSDDPLVDLSISKLKLNPNIPALGLLHGDLYDQKSNYAPLSVSGFTLDNGPQAWVIGHIHKPDVIKERSPHVFYPGSPQAMSAKESGVHGPVLLTLENGNVNRKSINLSPVRYEKLELDVRNMKNQTDVRTRISHLMRDFVKEQPGQFQNVLHTVFDIELTGTHSNLSELNDWVRNADEIELIESETKISVRKVINSSEPVVDNLNELAQQPTPPGMLAKLILDIESGKSSDLLEKLTENMTSQIESANQSGTYSPLSNFGQQIEKSSDAAKELLLRESRQLLSEMLAQKETN